MKIVTVNTKAKNDLIKKLQKSANNIANERDLMRNVISEFLDILEDIDQAYENLDQCIQILSQKL